MGKIWWMTGTQEARGRRIKDERLAGESFHTGQDLSPFGHPCWAGITNLEVRKDIQGPTAAHSTFILTL
jgi:hypothetical protein